MTQIKPKETYQEMIARIEREQETPNSYNPNLHIPHNVPGYKHKWEQSQKANMGLLIALLISVLIGIGTNVGASLRYKAELKASGEAYNKCEIAYRMSEIAYNEAVSILVNPNPQSIDAIINTVFGANAPVMKKVAMCESGLNPNARNKTSTARGVFQVMASVHQVQEKWLLNPAINTLIAKQLYDEQGLTPWVSSRGCWSK